MLAFLRGRASERKLRLLACACCRRIWEELSEPQREAVVLAERYADGLVAAAALREARVLADHLPPESEFNPLALPFTLPGAAVLAASAVPVEAVEALAQAGAVERVGRSLVGVDWVAYICSAQCQVIRDLFGPPSRSDRLEPVWLAWHGGAAVKLAQAVYEEPDPSSGHLDAARLAVLADALEEAGCADRAVLDHLRGRGQHVRGCWPLDLCLERE
jgi:hypothetical protein